MINMELDYARKMFYPIKHLIEWDTFEVCSGDDATRTMSNLIKNWKANGIPNDLSSCAACPRGQGDVTAAFVRLLDLADNIDVVLLCDIEHIGNLREAGCVIFDTQFSHLLYGDGYPKLGSGNVALLGEERTSKLAARFGFMELLGSAEHFCGLRSDDMAKARSLIGKQTLGLAKVPDKAPDRGWMRAYWQHRNRIDQKVFSDDATYLSLLAERKLVYGCQQIWDSELKRRHFTVGIKSLDFESASSEEIFELARLLGIDSMIEALYSGVPLGDIIA